MRVTLAAGRGSVRTQLWPLPTLVVLLAVAAGVALPHLDAAIDTDLPRWVRSATFGGGPDAARSVLGAISTSLMTVTSLTFSLTVVTLQLASSQFSPRLLRTFTSDVFVQITLAVFLGTFGFALTVLRSVRGPDSVGAMLVPRLSVTVAYVLTVASVIALVLFLAHLAREIRVETMLQTVYDDASETVAAVFSDSRTVAGVELRNAPGDEAARMLIGAPDSGFLVTVDLDKLLTAAVAADAVVRLDAHPGSFLVAGVPFAIAWSIDGAGLDTETRERLAGAVRDSARTGHERTAAQDVGFGLRQLTDVANKALSPGINDPTTAVHAIGHISALLCELADQPVGPVALRHGDRVHVVLARLEFAQLVEDAIGQIRLYGCGDPVVLDELYRLLGDLAWRVPQRLSTVVVDQLARLGRTVEAQDFDVDDVRRLAAHAQRIEFDLERRSLVW